MRKLFKSLDKNGDGQLSKAELLDGYHTVFGFADESMIEEIMEKLDKNESGFIDYSGTQWVFLNNKIEFVVAVMNKQKVLSQERLEHVFCLLDAVQFQDNTQ